jgi:hypothetical protein
MNSTPAAMQVLANNELPPKKWLGFEPAQWISLIGAVRVMRPCVQLSVTKAVHSTVPPAFAWRTLRHLTSHWTVSGSVRVTHAALPFLPDDPPIATSNLNEQLTESTLRSVACDEYRAKVPLPLVTRV